MIIKRDTWERSIELNINRPKVLVVSDINQFHMYLNEMIEQSNGESGKFMVFGSDKQISFESEIEIIPNIFTISMNTRKILTNLYKRISKEISIKDQGIMFEDIKDRMKQFLESIRKETLIDFKFNADEIEVEDIFKLYSVKYSEDHLKPAELLQKYIDLIKEVIKLKLVIVVFANYVLSNQEVNDFAEYCILNGINLVFLEKEKPQNLSEKFDIVYTDEICMI